MIERLRELYAEYYHSIPTEHWMSKRRHMFKAKSIDDMTDIEMMSGANRDEAERNLEEFVKNELIPQGWQWPGKWFYQDTEYPTLILLAEWF